MCDGIGLLTLVLWLSLLLPLLLLLVAVEDVMRGVFATRTRAASHGNSVTLRPMHDMLNHAAMPNTACTLTDDG